MTPQVAFLKRLSSPLLHEFLTSKNDYCKSINLSCNYQHWTRWFSYPWKFCEHDLDIGFDSHSDAKRAREVWVYIPVCRQLSDLALVAVTSNLCFDSWWRCVGFILFQQALDVGEVVPSLMLQPLAIQWGSGDLSQLITVNLTQVTWYERVVCWGTSSCI